MTAYQLQLEQEAVFGLILAAIIVIVSFFASYRSQSRRRLIEALPTSATQGVFIGLVEIKGTAESEQPLRTYLAGLQAVYYRWSVEEHWERWETETYTDKDGKTRTRQVRKSGWSTVASGGESQPFYLRDHTGALLIRPDGADVRGFSVFYEHCTPSDPLYYGKGPSRSIMDSTHRRRFSETAIPLHEELYIVGQARERSDIVAAEVAAHEAAPIYLVTTETEEQVRRRLGASVVLWTLGGVIAAGGIGWLLGREAGTAIAAAAYLAVTALLRIILLYNSLVDTRNRMRQGFSQIDVQLHRRASLIPNLVKTVKAAARHEKDVQTLVAEFRAEATATPPGERGSNPSPLLPKLRLLAEQYPQLGSDAHFLRLQNQLTETEQRIALARAYFNDIATEWNNRVERFPDSLLAKLSGFRRQSLFETRAFERAPLDVKLPIEACRRRPRVYSNGMKSPFGVKMTSGKVIWVKADDVECVDGSLMFYRVTSEGEEVVAGFNLQKVDHFGRPEAFETDKSSDDA